MRKIIEVKSEIDQSVMEVFDDPRGVRRLYDWLLIEHEAKTKLWYVVESRNYGLSLKERKDLGPMATQYVYKSQYKVLLGQLPNETNRTSESFINSVNKPKTTDKKFNKVVLKGFKYMKQYMEGRDGV